MHVLGFAIFATVLAVVPTHAYRLRRTAEDDDCLNECRAFVGTFQEGVCEPFRYRVPRPALYSRCTEAYTTGTAAGCAYCTASASKLAHITDGVFHYCDQWGRGHDRGYEQACKDGYLAAVTNVKRFLKASAYDPVRDDDEADGRPKIVAANSIRRDNDDVESAESIVQRHVRCHASSRTSCHGSYYIVERSSPGSHQ
ncbi:hypothetical protein DYB32_006678 [Aphanomyces invadans]|uniref:Uncharacterized protein n=1 Tax=Aphanomyces invadans TaxID=157072 RepID=A0A418AR00_9STRA|nr:hypothetical protein DYB32_006678 [Aphanomyces invadans]